MVPVLMMGFLFTNTVAHASTGADKYLKNHSTSSKPKKHKVSKKKAKPSVKVGKKYERSVASVGKVKKHNKKKKTH